jgi:hypothetical protein
MNNIVRNKSKLNSLLAVSLFVLAFIELQPDRVLAQTTVTTTQGGTIGQIPKWSATSNLENSIITESSGKIGIGTLNPESLFHVAGLGIFSRTMPTGDVASLQSALQVGLNGGTMVAGGGPSLLFFSDNNGTTPTKHFMGRISGIWENPAAGSEAAGIAFHVRGGSGDVFINQTEVMRLTASSKVGIGIKNPVNLFHVAPIQYNLGSASQAATTINGSGTTFTPAMVGSLFVFADGTRRTITGYTSATQLTVAESSTVAAQNYTINYVGLNVNSTGYVGIGTTTPDIPLTVKRDASGEVQMRINSNNTNFYLGAEWVSGVPAIGTNTATPMTLVTNNAERFRIDHLGNVGIGTIAPTVPLHIRNGQSVDGTTLLVENSNGLTNEAGTIALKGQGAVITRIQGDYFNGTSFSTRTTAGALRIANNGKLGIGTNTTTAEYGIQFGTDSAANLYRSGTATIKTDGTLQANTFSSNNLSSTSVTTPLVASTAALGLTPAAGNNLNISLSTTGDLAVNTNQLYVDTSTARVGIGTTTPSTALHVVGDVTVTGNLAAKYQDVAEWVPARTALSAGTVVVLDTEQSNQVMASAVAYDTRVAGVISVQPGLILGEGGAGKVMVATTGRVRMKVDATNAPIGVGDLLVTSAQEGVAMRSEPLDLAGTKIHRPGTIIGKALEPLAKGKGEILVLLSMQ